MSESTPAILHSADVGGEKIYCADINDAEGLKLAGDILDGIAELPRHSTEVDYLATLLLRLGRERAG